MKRIDVDRYTDNPLIHRDRRPPDTASAWVQSFACDDVRPLIVCRGPIRKEAMDVFEQMGITHFGILLSEKDSIVHTHALAPELRCLSTDRVHRVKDYTGATSAERVQRIDEIIKIARTCGYDSIFAGYGFMAEDEDFVRRLEEAGLRFIGPCSRTVHAAGQKDEAKRTALAEQVSVTPGVNDVTTRLLLRKAPDLSALKKLAQKHELEIAEELLGEPSPQLPALAGQLLDAAYAAGVDLYSIDELAAEVETQVKAVLEENAGSRLRLKAIGGGGGKGQRVLETAAPAASMAREILSEVKATGVGDNKNILIELNIEQTRHNEIQLIGNGEWCLALGGRDCSLQMHDQKLLEVSITREELERAIADARHRDAAAEMEALQADLTTLKQMEEQAERFGRAVGLDSASTFECIVEHDRHFFMEVNTRIQVEHRVSELCYTLRFTNPDDQDDHLEVDSLVECMVLLARHGERLPRPARVPRLNAAVEARLNATDRALQPHAGGLIVGWSAPIEGEIRDDQGICERNPDTGLFMQYRLAGSYDSNIALLVTHGERRRASYERLAEIIRRTRLRGHDLSTNLEFHHGLVHWFLARNVMAKPTTRFVVPYLTQVGLLKEVTREIDVVQAFGALMKARQAADGPSEAGLAAWAGARKAYLAKQTLLKRPLDRMWAEPHFLSAWLSRNRENYESTEGRVRWLKNPADILADTYWLLNMTYREDEPAAQVIWHDDHLLLERARGFYRRLEERLGDTLSWPELEERLADSRPPKAFSSELWSQVRGAHEGFSAGLEILGLAASVGHEAGFHELDVKADLTVHIPDRLLDAGLQDRMRKVLVPPPATRADAIVAVSGGMFYRKEAPGRPPLINLGDHFDRGDPLYIIEVMKMFNKAPAPFAGTIDAILVETDGTIVKKGQPLFAVTPDEVLAEEDVEEVARRVKAKTEEHVRTLLGAKGGGS